MAIQDYFYAALNPLVRGLLRSPLHGVASGNLAVLRYRGRRSGRSYETPLSYVREGDLVRLMSSRRTRWWRNFGDTPTPVEVEIARRRLPGRARLLGEDGERFRDGVRRFLSALPRDARVYGIRLDAQRRPREEDVETAFEHVILVEVELDAGSG